MADIELIVKISEDTYKDIIKNGFIYDEDNEVVTHAIKNGISFDKVRAEMGAEIQKMYMFRDYTNGLAKALEIIDKYMEK